MAKAIMEVRDNSDRFSTAALPFACPDIGKGRNIMQDAGAMTMIHGLLDQQMELELHNDELLGIRKEKEAALLRYEEMYNSAPVGYVTLDQYGLIVDINVKAQEMLGTEQNSLLSKPFAMCVAPNFRTDYLDQWQYIVETGRQQNVRVDMLTKGGTVFPASLICRILPNNMEKNIRYLVVINDLTDYIKVQMRLHETNTALKVLLSHRELDRDELDKNILSNVRKLVIPYLEKLKMTRLNARQTECLNIIESNIQNILSPFLNTLTANYSELTPREIDVANMVKEGRIAKEIADVLGISTRSVEFHKENIRQKMGLTNKKINLQSYLIYLDNKQR